MSYDINLYDKKFLMRALEKELEDWTGADAISTEAKERAIAAAQKAGFERQQPDAGFAKYMAKEELPLAPEWLLETESTRAQLTVFNGLISFSVPISPKAKASIELCVDLARKITTECGLAYHDPQSGAVVLG